MKLDLDRTSKFCGTLSRHTTASYNILQGIDQGEVISPILWIFYYDSLFHRINSTTDSQYTQYTRTVTNNKISNIYNRNSDQLIITKAALVGCLDDTSWFASLLPQLESNLQIANTFYELANISVNHDKYEILTNDVKFCNKEIDIHATNNKTIKSKSLPKTQAKAF
jgi:hypothetical protein